MTEVPNERDFPEEALPEGDETTEEDDPGADYAEDEADEGGLLRRPEPRD